MVSLGGEPPDRIGVLRERRRLELAQQCQPTRGTFDFMGTVIIEHDRQGARVLCERRGLQLEQRNRRSKDPFSAWSLTIKASSCCASVAGSSRSNPPSVPHAFPHTHHLQSFRPKAASAALMFVLSAPIVVGPSINEAAEIEASLPGALALFWREREDQLQQGLLVGAAAVSHSGGSGTTMVVAWRSVLVLAWARPPLAPPLCRRTPPPVALAAGPSPPAASNTLVWGEAAAARGAGDREGNSLMDLSASFGWCLQASELEELEGVRRPEKKSAAQHPFCVCATA